VQVAGGTVDVSGAPVNPTEEQGMDPIKRAILEFTASAEAFWRTRPGRLLPLIAAEDDRQLVVQALRLREHAADNRRPLVVYEAPFVSAETYFPGLADALARHYELVRQGAAEEGVELPPFAGDDGTVPSGVLKRAAIAMNRAAHLLGEGFDGIVIALVPEHIAGPEAWRDSIAVLAATRWLERVRVAALAPPGGPLSAVLGSEGARLNVDSGEVLGFVRQLAAQESAGPVAALDVPPAAPAPAAAAGPEDGAPAPGAGERLRVLVLDAAEALAAGRPTEAAAVYREARRLCQAENLPEQEAAMLTGLGGAYLAAQKPRLAADAYRESAGVAEQAEAWPLACQGWLGMGGA
jgi:hypothetical protein